MTNRIYNIGVERETLRCTYNGELSETKHPEVFGNKQKNKFITVSKIEQQMKICTPKCDDIYECYMKIEEITDVVIAELYEKEELLWASSLPCIGADNKLVSNVKLKFSFVQDEYKTIKEKYDNIPVNEANAYLAIMKALKEDLKDLYGDIEISILNNELQISNIIINPFDKCGISLDGLFNLTSKIIKIFVDTYNLENKLLLKAKHNIQENKKDVNEIKKLNTQDILEISRNNMEEGYSQRYSLRYHPKLVPASVALIKDALSQGIDYQVLNETTSFVEVNDNGHKEFVIEGNKTNRDSYIFPIITDDKLIAKNIIKDYGFNTPKGIVLNKDISQEEKDELIEKFLGQAMVVKPRNTNKGTGITVFTEYPDKENLNQALEYAFGFDKDILVEEYISGKEYRFLVIDGKCISVVHRRAASVVGDGISTIKELIDRKNKEPWHKLAKKPVKMEESVEMHLKTQGYTYESILEKGKRVFLRNNSNCSTGGESIDITEKVSEYFKNIAEEIANIFEEKICGVDLIINDLNSENYSIIEINDNPGYTINEWPYEGKGARAGIAVLKLLGY